MAQKLEQDLNIIQRSGVEIQIDPLTKDLNIIQALDDEPNDVGGLSAAELKAKFDEAGNIIKGFINDILIPQVLGDGLTEQNRQENEAVRQANEAARQENETARQEAEEAREEAEETRETAEAARAAAETQRATDFTEAQGERAAAFTEAQEARAAAFSASQEARETAFAAAQADQEARFQAAEDARDVWEDYNPAKTYVPGNKVYYLGSSYVNTRSCADVLPTVEENWQIVAKKGADGDGGMSQEEGDLRYLQLSGGRMTGPVTVLAPEKEGNPVPLGYADLRYLRLTGGRMTGPLTVQDPAQAGNPVTKGYFEKNAFWPQVIVTTTEAGAVVTCTDGSTSLQQVSTGQPIVFNLPNYGNWSVSGTLDGFPSNTVNVAVDTVKQYTAALSFFASTITVNVESGSTVTCAKGSYTQTKTSAGSVSFTVREAGTYTITAVKGLHEESGTVQVTASGQAKTIALEYTYIYGASWDGSSTTRLTRTDDAALFTDPVPAVGNGAGSSPFDSLYPWSGMEKVTDGGNVLVKIPKYWVKVSHAPFKVQISNKALPGYQVSPAHRDRGDGKGERDVVYIGRYECDGSYMSRSGQAPKVSTTLATFRNGIHGLGAAHWQADYAIQLTWWFLYIVEFADWNGQAAIGQGNINGSAAINTGATDSMAYHTGRAAGTDGQTAVQYRNIENPWGNVREWRDGIIFSDANISTYNNPANFSDSYNGAGATVRSNKRATTNGWIEAWGHDTNDPSFIYPSEVGGSQKTFVPDFYNYETGVNALLVGGNFFNGVSGGPFCLAGSILPNYTEKRLGSRLQKLP